jgi:hypothetical protein
MKLFVLAILVLLLTGMTEGFPSHMENDPSVCKIVIDTGTSYVIQYAWQNTTTHVWEVQIVTKTYAGMDASPMFYGQPDGIVSIEKV